jgi:YVTN family beta-propeller protein
VIARAAPLLGALLLGLPGCVAGEEERDERRRAVVEPPVSVAGVELYPVPDAVVKACRSTQRQASIPILCPTRLPRAVRDLAGSSGVPPPVLTAFSWNASGLDFSYSAETGEPRLDHPDRFFHLQVVEQDRPLPPGTRGVRLGGRTGLLAPASSRDYSSESYFANHWRFFWTEHGVRYAATVHHFGPRTRRLLARLVRHLRPVATLRRRGAPRSPGVRTIDVPVAGPVSVAARGDDVWVAGQGDRVASGTWLARIDANAGRVSGDRIRIIGQGGATAVLAGSSVWVAHRGVTGTAGLQRLDPDSGELTPAAALPAELVALAEAAGSLWAVDHRGTVSRTSRAGDRVMARVPVGRAPAGVAAGAGDVWVTNNLDDTLARIDARTNRVIDTIPVPAGPVGVTYGHGAVWVASHEAGTVARIEPRSNRVVETIRVGRGPRAIAAGVHGIWVTNELDDTVARMDPRANRVVETVRVGAGPAGIALGAGAVWVANNHDRTVTGIALPAEP